MRWFCVVAVALSWAHAILTAGQGLPGIEAADGYVAALTAWDGVPSGVLARWCGAWMAVFGRSEAALAASYLPFHVLMAVGLWRGGRALGRDLGGGLAVLTGLGAAGVLTGATQATSGFPVAACVAFAVGAVLAGAGQAGAGLPVAGERREPSGASVRRWLGPVTAVCAAIALALPLSRTLAAADVPPLLVALAQPTLLAAVVAALVLRGDSVVLGLLGCAGALVGAAIWAGSAAVLLSAVPVLAIAAAGVSAHRGALLTVGALALVQLAAFDARTGWPGRPEALRPVPRRADEADIVIAAVGSLATRGGGTVATWSLHERLHAGVFAVAAAERGLPLRFVSTDAPTSELGLIVRPKVGATPREGWRTQLPQRDGAVELGDGYVIEVWYRGLPPEALLAAKLGEERNHPSQQALYRYAGAEEGPLIPDASSPEVVETDRGVEALFVRNQALWHASGDGTRFDAPRPLLDAEGAPIAAFDPNVVRLPDGSFRLYAAELVGSDRTVDPALHPTRIASWRGASLDKLTREPGERLTGIGVVDPAIEDRWGLWVLYVTTDRRYVSKAESSDGLTFGPLEPYVEATVPAVTPIGLVVQRQVMGWSVLHRYDPTDRLINPTGGFTSLDLCGTGASWAAGAVYYTRAAEPCPEPIVMPRKRSELLDTLIRKAAE